MRSDHRHLTAYQIACEVGQSVDLVLRPAILNRHILALDVAGFTKALAECGQISCTIDRRRAAEEPNHRHSRLLRARRERPRGRATEKQYELAPFQLIELHSKPTSQRRFAGYRIGRDQSAGIGALAKPVPAPPC